MSLDSHIKWSATIIVALAALLVAALYSASADADMRPPAMAAPSAFEGKGTSGDGSAPANSDDVILVEAACYTEGRSRLCYAQ
jgi:hypothetical protein